MLSWINQDSVICGSKHFFHPAEKDLPKSVLPGAPASSGHPEASSGLSIKVDKPLEASCWPFGASGCSLGVLYGQPEPLCRSNWMVWMVNGDLQMATGDL